jgi:hypothetical protein
MSDEQTRANTRLALKQARAGIPPNALPGLDQHELDTFLGAIALDAKDNLPRAVRRAGYAEVVGNALLAALSTGFWLGAAYVVQGDQES